MQFKRSFFQIAALSLLPLMAACSHSPIESASLSAAAPAAAAVDGRIVARVNGQEITAGELKQAEKIAFSSKPGMQIPPNLLKDFEQQILNQLVGTELLYQASQKTEIKDLDQKTAAKIAEIKKGFPTQDDYTKKLGEIGLDENALAKSVRHDLAISEFVNSTIANKITVSEAEIKKFYDDNRKNFNVPEQVRTSHILIGVDPKAGAEAKQAARDKAEKLRAELVKGADFATLARENSTCPSSKQGGDLGFFGKGRMDPSFEKAAFALKEGELSPVVETRFGYHVIKLVERKKAEEVTFAAAKEKIETYLKSMKTKTAVEAFIGTARSNAKIEML